ncbi:MAG TPA: PilZ domain-containing protein [Phycisphaerae bacterium]|nr:PilZ domain-containing protein [Phycisphaerae bacterium]HRW54554.1 PilZ domain-containing protein [Phycisphaerae bacterium]
MKAGASESPAKHENPARVMAMLRKQADADSTTVEKRGSDRYAWRTRLRVTIVDPSGARREIDVTTHDLSIGGFSFMFNQYVHNGTVVIACIKALPEKPMVLCVVRNCVHVKGAMHRVGVNFERVSTNR